MGQKQHYIALLRGINVSGQKIIKMEDLRKRMTTAGYENVSTYIQSGNIVFGSTEKSAEKVRKALTEFLMKEYGFEIAVFVLKLADIQKAVKNNPFIKDAIPEESNVKRQYVCFLNEAPAKENVKALIDFPLGKDKIELKDNVLYFQVETKSSESKLSNNFIENKLKVKATTRNWNTTLTMLQMLEETEDGRRKT